MTGALLALGSALCYGIADVAGGLLSRRADFRTVAFLGQAGGLVCAVVAALLLPVRESPWHGIAWGFPSGVGTGIAMVFLYRGISRGTMSVVVPVSAVGGVALPVLVGVILLGDRPSLMAWTGIAVVLPALWLVSRSRSDERDRARPAIANGLVASAGIGVQYLALAQAGDEAGLWPVAAGRVAAVLTIAPMVVRSRPPRFPEARTTVYALVTGAVAATALALYLLATARQLVVIAVVLSSLYPVVPVLWGVTALRERLSAGQVAGLVAAGAAVLLLTLPPP
ncbi:EamA family transporter [Actinomadura verrucosospora]|uniref:Permease of the drug/metabolite transporter (DMT) superfamily n=1 Tax=Actinomadura verrucosospora TaxID=46165 RepID=A0A7D3ZLN3_ACTVE|nr:GRP family sugar transporter [Actinomadura verrucosospora]QKG21422.1 permease of the drug/metabolite transporter (DMT) superfamily [Actinomadura verrucosospora]